MCVLAKLLNKDTVRCSDFFSKSMELGGISLCNSAQTSSCKAFDSLPRISGGNITIRSCTDEIKCYDGDVELCQISNNPEDRINPSSSLEHTLSEDQYYNTTVAGPYPNSPSSSAGKYGNNQEGVRDKTPVELGLCVAVPQGRCPAENNPDKDTGFARWPAADLGKNSLGVCEQGKVPKKDQKDLIRKCIPNPSTRAFNLEPVYRIKRDQTFNIPYKVYPTNIECVKPPPPREQ